MDFIANRPGIDNHGKWIQPWVLALLLAGSCVLSFGADSQQGMVATAHPLASAAALETLKSGGNAVDAAVAAGLTLGVVDAKDSGIGGGCFMLIRKPDGTFMALDGRETAPARATRNMFLRGGKADPALSRTGALAPGVPGSLAVYDYAIRRYGKQSLKAHLLRAGRLAEQGFVVEASFARGLAAQAKLLASFPSSKAVFLKPDGGLYRAGDHFTNPALAKTYRHIADQGIEWFYGGPFARAVEQWMKTHGGVLAASDFHDYQWKERQAVRTTYRGHDIVGFPPPSSGGIHVAQILNILEDWDLKAMGPRSPELIHVVSEAMKLAFADRAHWLGDADFVPVPRGLVDKAYARRLGRKIRRDKILEVPGHGTPDRAEEDVFGKHTTHFSVADASGYWVACTATVNTHFGSKVVVPGTGVVLNNQMDDFSAQPGVPNAFGLVGAEANAVAPGKRPLSSMSPTIVLRDGKPILSVGAAGGPTIITQSLLTIIRVVDFGMTVEQALAEPRFHHQWKPDVIRIEKAFGEMVMKALEERGHTLKKVSTMGVSQAVALDPRTGTFSGAADPRGDGKAMGY